MPNFEFIGRNKDGKKLIDQRLSVSIDSLYEELLKENITPISIKVIKAEKQKESVLKTILHSLQRKKVTLEELSIFSRQMEILTKTGIPIAIAINQLAESARSLHMREVLTKVTHNLASGKDLVDSVQEFPEVFTPLMVSMIRIGQSSGRLDEAFAYLYRYLDLESVTAKRIKTAARYPFFVLTSIFLSILLIGIFVIPTFSKVYERARIPLPTATLILINMTNFIKNDWYICLIFLAILIFSMYFYLKTPSGKLKWHTYMLKVPIVGNIMKRLTLLRFTQIFAIVFKAGIPINQGLGLVAQTIHNIFIRQKILQMRDAIERGTSLTKAAKDAHFFSPLELQMFAVGESTGELGSMFEQVALFYQREVDYDLKKLGDIIQPLLILCLAIVVLLLALAVYLPIWNMVKLVRH